MNVHGLHSGSGAQYGREVREYNVSLDVHGQSLDYCKFIDTVYVYVHCTYAYRKYDVQYTV